MQKKYPISAPRVALTAVLTTSVLLACTPGNQQLSEHGQIKSLPYSAPQAASVGPKTRPKMQAEVALEDKRLKYDKVEKSASLADVTTALSNLQAGRMQHAKQMISPMYSVHGLHSIQPASEPVNRENYLSL